MVSRNEVVHSTFVVWGELSIAVDMKVVGIRMGAFSAAISIGMLSTIIVANGISMYAERICACV